MLRRILSRFTTLPRRKAAATRPARSRPQLEVLEDRTVPAALFSNVPVSDTGTGNAIAEANTSRNVAVTPTGAILVAYTGDQGIRVARSTDRGQSFRPSIQVTDTNAEVDLKVASNGRIYVAWVEEGTVLISRSTDNGKTFSDPSEVGETESDAVHLAAMGKFVYVVPADSPAGQVVFVNGNGGQGAFTSTTVDTNGRVFADVQVDPRTGYVYVISDNPTLRVFRSKDHAASFKQVALSNPNASIFFSSTTISAGDAGLFAFVSGGSNGGSPPTAAFQINLDNGATTALTFGAGTDSQGRSLSADSSGNVVDAFFSNGSIQYHVSHNFGKTFDPVVTVAAARSSNVAINPLTDDILVAFQKNGQIFLSVFSGELSAFQGWFRG